MDKTLTCRYCIHCDQQLQSDVPSYKAQKEYFCKVNPEHLVKVYPEFCCNSCEVFIGIHDRVGYK